MKKHVVDSIAFAGVDLKLDRQSPLPLYVQVRSRLLAMIMAWPDEREQFPTEAALTEMFGVSRVTVRGALAELAESGYLQRQRGAGTRVRAHKIEEKLSLGRNLAKKWISGDPMKISVVSFATIEAPENVAAALKLASKTPVLAIKRLRAMKVTPISVDWRYVPPDLAKGITRTDARTGIFATLARNAALTRADMEVEGCSASAEEAELLQVPEGTAMLSHSFVVCDKADRPVVFGRSVARADLTRYAVKMDLTPETVG
ncbi:MAG: GntR family transcriptional regulator [Magnetospirillum sp.]|nr:GntR family transcriptional regulator [Magnetospirillum sp.]